MVLSEGAQATLLKWLNGHLPFDLDRHVDKIDDLADGLVFAQVLRDIDHDYDASELERNVSSSPWLTKKRNLQSVYKALFRYIRREEDQGFRDNHYEYLAVAHDFRAVAENPDSEGLAQLLAVFVAVALSYPGNSRYISLIQKMTQQEMMSIKTLMGEKLSEALEAEKKAQLEDTQDPDLLLEAERAAWHAREDTLLKKNADLLARIEHVQLAMEDMREKDQKSQLEIDELRGSLSQNESDQAKTQTLRIKEQEDYIATMEGHLEEISDVRAKLERENHQLSMNSTKASRLQDEVQELKYANEELSKKANTVDRYKQKLESLKLQETQMRDQQYEIEDLKSRLIGEESLQSRIKQLEANQRRFQDRLQGYELEVVELSSQKKALEHELYAVRSALSSTAEKLQSTENFAAELQSQSAFSSAADRRASSGSDEEPPAGALSLEHELNSTSDPATTQKLEITRLRTENQLLREGMGGAADSTELRSELELTLKKHDIMKEKYTEIYDKYAAGQRQIEAMKLNMQGEGLSVFDGLQQETLLNTEKLSSAEKNNKSLEEQLADRDRELLSLRAEFEAVEKSSADALEQLKATDSLVAGSLKKELEAERKRNEMLTLDLQQQKDLHLRALMAKDELREQLEKLSAAPSNISEDGAGKEAGAEQVKKANESIEKLRERVKLQKEQLKKVEKERFELQRRIKAMEQAGDDAGHKVETQQTIKNLKRELAMVATAWYDLASRMQSNHMVLQRRQDMPKSWMNKQRQMVNAAPRR